MRSLGSLCRWPQAHEFRLQDDFVRRHGPDAKQNAIVLIDEINARQEAGDSAIDAVVSAGITRLRPVGMAAATTVLGMIPLVADPFYSAMAVTVMCGLAFATVLTMIVIPVNYAIFFHLPAPGNKRGG